MQLLFVVGSLTEFCCRLLIVLCALQISYENHFFTLYSHTLEIRETAEFLKKPIVALTINETSTLQLRVVPGIKDPSDTRLLVVNTPDNSVEMLAGSVEDARGWMGVLQHFRSSINIDFESEAGDPKTPFLMEAANLAAPSVVTPISPNRSIDDGGKNMTDLELMASFPGMTSRRYLETHFEKAENQDIGIRLVGGSGPGSNWQKPFIYVASCRANSLGSTADLRMGDIINKVGKRALKDVTVKEAQRILDSAFGKLCLGVARSRKEPLIRQPYHDNEVPMPEDPKPEMQRQSSEVYGFDGEGITGFVQNVEFVDMTIDFTREDVSNDWGFQHLSNNENQLVVTSVTPHSEADGLLRLNDIILSVNGQTALLIGETFNILAERLIKSRPQLKLVIRRINERGLPVVEPIVEPIVEPPALTQEAEEFDFGSSFSTENDETVPKADTDELYGFGEASPTPSPAPSLVKAAIDDISGGAEEEKDRERGTPPQPPPGTPSKMDISKNLDDVLSPLPASDSPEKIARKSRLDKMRASRKVRKMSMDNDLGEIFAWIDNLPDDY